MNKKAFWKKVEENYNQVKKWSKWKRLITISAATAETGMYQNETK